MTEITSAISRIQTQFTSALVTALGAFIQVTLILALGFRYVSGTTIIATNPNFSVLLLIFFAEPIIFFLNVTLFFSTPVKVLISVRNYAIVVVLLLIAAQDFWPETQYHAFDTGLLLNLIYLFPSLVVLRLLFPRILGLALIDQPVYAADYVDLKQATVEDILDKSAIRRAFGITEKDTSTPPFVIYSSRPERSYQLHVFLREKEGPRTEIRFIGYSKNDYETVVTDATRLRFDADVEAIGKAIANSPAGNVKLHDMTGQDSYDKELAIRIAEQPTVSPAFTALKVPTVAAVLGLAAISLIAVGFLHSGKPALLDTNNTIVAVLTIVLFSALYIFEAYRSRGRV